jgi:hypothetical protein
MQSAILSNLYEFGRRQRSEVIRLLKEHKLGCICSCEDIIPDSLYEISDNIEELYKLAQQFVDFFLCKGVYD